MTLQKKVVDTLKTINDPGLRQDVYTLNLVSDIKINEKKKAVKMKFKPTVFNCPLGIQLALSIKKTLLKIDALTRVDIEVVDFHLAKKANEYLKSLDKIQKKEE